jgi:hypothetical protein
LDFDNFRWIMTGWSQYIALIQVISLAWRGEGWGNGQCEADNGGKENCSTGGGDFHFREASDYWAWAIVTNF